MKLKIICNYTPPETQAIELEKIIEENNIEMLKTIVRNIIIDNPQIEVESVEAYD